MKITRVLSILMLILSCSILSAQFTPYGSARIGFWYENEQENWDGISEDRLNLNYFLQSNSRFGARFKNGYLQGRIEFGGRANLRLLWAAYNMGNYSILIGQDDTIVTQDGDVVNNCDGFGAIDDGRRPQIRFDFDNGIRFAFVIPSDKDASGIKQEKIILLPKLNIAYEKDLSELINLKSAAGLNYYSYDKNFGQYDNEVLSYLVAVLMEMKIKPVTVVLHGNYGQNTGNYGIVSQTDNLAFLKDNKTINAVTKGGFSEFIFELNPKSILTLGASYTTTKRKDFKTPDNAFHTFVQLRYQVADKFRIYPEIGMMDRMNDGNGNKQGRMFYSGSKIRMDF